jgi:hypothetical protein
MTRRCKRCLQPLPLQAFDLCTEQVSSTCLACSRAQSRADAVPGVRVAALESRRGALIGELIQLDAKIALFRSRDDPQFNQLLTALKRRRQAQIVALVKIDAELADLRPRTPPPRLVVDEVQVAEAPFDDDTYDDECVREI